MLGMPMRLPISNNQTLSNDEEIILLKVAEHSITESMIRESMIKIQSEDSPLKRQSNDQLGLDSFVIQTPRPEDKAHTINHGKDKRKVEFSSITPAARNDDDGHLCNDLSQSESDLSFEMKRFDKKVSSSPIHPAEDNFAVDDIEDLTLIKQIMGKHGAAKLDESNRIEEVQ